MKHPESITLTKIHNLENFTLRNLFSFQTVQDYQLDISVKQGRQKLKEIFRQNAHVKDVKVIDMLVIKVISHYYKCLKKVIVSFFSVGNKEVDTFPQFLAKAVRVLSAS